MSEQNALMHYGVLGMHWGIRRFQPYSNGSMQDKRKMKLTRQNEKLEAKRAKAVSNAEKYNQKAIAKVAKGKRIITGFSVNKDGEISYQYGSDEKTMRKATKLSAKSAKQLARAAKFEQKIARNNVKMGDLSQKQIARGEKFVKKAERNTAKLLKG